MSISVSPFSYQFQAPAHVRQPYKPIIQRTDWSFIHKSDDHKHYRKIPVEMDEAHEVHRYVPFEHPIEASTSLLSLPKLPSITPAPPPPHHGLSPALGKRVVPHHCVSNSTPNMPSLTPAPPQQLQPNYHMYPRSMKPPSKSYQTYLRREKDDSCTMISKALHNPPYLEDETLRDVTSTTNVNKTVPPEWLQSMKSHVEDRRKKH
eukprot:PhF_6_TR29143/c0_g1_i2/m.42572